LYTVSSGNYTQYSHDGWRVLVFSTSGRISFNGAANKTVNCAVVGGGGSGVGHVSQGGGGGGGAGAVLYLTLSGLDTDVCSFVVGQGGAVRTALGQGNGQSSSISFSTNTSFNRTAEGGGLGARSYPSNGSSAAPGSGGCGGGGPADATFKGFNVVRKNISRLDTIARQTIGALVERPITKEELLGMPAISANISMRICLQSPILLSLMGRLHSRRHKSMTLMLIFLVFWVTDDYMMGSEISVGDTVEYSAER
jgi:hypothetical protein